MNKRPTKKIQVGFDREYTIDENVKVSDWVDAILSATSEIVNQGFSEPLVADVGHSWDDNELYISLVSSREETDVEFEKRLEKWDAEEKLRIEKDETRILKTKQTVEAKERKLLERLKKKYES